MRIRPTILIVLLSVVLQTLTANATKFRDWPVWRLIDLSSGFGEYRLNRFHAGIDIRTAGKEGVKVYSVVDGYVWRIRTSYEGYGKGLYVKGNDGYIYVFGHLRDFSGKIDDTLKQLQLATKRYYQDFELPPGAIEVKAQQRLGYSGQTGAKAPHLHFEKRTPDNRPLNPLKHGFVLWEDYRPLISKVSFTLTDNYSLFPNGARTLTMDTEYHTETENFILATVPYFNRPFGILVDCFDRLRPGGMELNVYKLELFIDDSLRYQVTFDTLNFEHQRSVNLEYDLPKAAKKYKRSRRLFHQPGNEYPGSRSSDANGGVFGRSEDEKIGLHRCRIVAYDCYRSTRELNFDFVWGPADGLYRLDSTATDTLADTMSFYLAPAGHWPDLAIDSVSVFENIGDTWEVSRAGDISYLADGTVRFRTARPESGPPVLRLFAYSGGAVIPDLVFSGLQDNQENTDASAAINCEVISDGLLVTVNTEARLGASPRLELYYEDSLLGIEYPQFFNVNRYVAFISPRQQYARIDRIGFAWSNDPGEAVVTSIPADIYLVGAGVNGKIQVGDNFSVSIAREHLYRPRYVQLMLDDPEPGHFRLLPEVFVCAGDFEVAAVSSTSDPSTNSGICWYDDQDTQWVWLDNVYSPSEITAAAGGGGAYALLIDTVSPTIEKLSITNGLTYYNPMFSIDFLLSDSLSGFEDDRNILIELDGQWMIPEYNPNTRVCKTRPLKPLADGRHDLRVVVTDRAGNTTEQRLHFFVKRQ
ncbi:MAG: M23 family metallopeptidase [Candidatus Zixiibacteriota bacterium]|nr:MAG: M23 family metallopeptidase [candidate division Zixibacteria bacterium]